MQYVLVCCMTLLAWGGLLALGAVKNAARDELLFVCTITGLACSIKKITKQRIY